MPSLPWSRCSINTFWMSKRIVKRKKKVAEKEIAVKERKERILGEGHEVHQRIKLFRGTWVA